MSGTPLGTEILDVLRRPGLPARDLLRARDAAFRDLGLTGDEPEDELVAAMARHPTLLQRPIGLAGDRAVLGDVRLILIPELGERTRRHPPRGHPKKQAPLSEFFRRSPLAEVDLERDQSLSRTSATS